MDDSRCKPMTQAVNPDVPLVPLTWWNPGSSFPTGDKCIVNHGFCKGCPIRFCKKVFAIDMGGSSLFIKDAAKSQHVIRHHNCPVFLPFGFFDPDLTCFKVYPFPMQFTAFFRS